MESLLTNEEMMMMELNHIKSVNLFLNKQGVVNNELIKCYLANEDLQNVQPFELKDSYTKWEE